MVKVFIKTYGCARNIADSEAMAYYLQKEGHEVFGLDSSTNTKNNLQNCDVLIINSCTVKNPTQDKFFSFIKQVKKDIPHIGIILAGCIPQASPDLLELQNFCILGVDKLEDINMLVSSCLNKKILVSNSREKEFSRKVFPILRAKKNISIIPILSGCLGNCSYCKTKQARGWLKSRNSQEICEEIIFGLDEGVKEFWLVSEDNGAWGKDKNLCFIDLLKDISLILKDYPDCRVRIGMMNPQYVLEYLDELNELLLLDCFFKFLHIPIQSGSDEVLKVMNRKYFVEDIYTVVNGLRSVHKNIRLSTDIICGFPNETNDNWKQTMNVLKDLDFCAINISKFYPRKGTLASEMKLLATDIVKSRSKELSDWFEKKKNSKYVVGEIVDVLIDEDKDENKYVVSGHTNNYTKAIVHLEEKEKEKSNECIGSWMRCKITKINRDDIWGEREK
jgi:threonylcarbamoyladenosine tRNA methylthiotransferase CDKAL1